MDFGSDFDEGDLSVGQRTIREQIKAKMAERKLSEAPQVPLRHADFPEVIIICRLPTDGEEVAEIAHRAEKKAKNAATSSVWFNRLLIARFTTQIEWHQERFEDDQGVPWTFASRELQELLGAADAPSAVAKLFGSDAYVAAIASELMDRAGFGNDAAVEVMEDPTTDR